MANPAPTERPMPVGYRFHPTEQELVGHYLHHKLMANDPSIHDTIPEIDICKYEPWDLLDWASSAASSTKFDDFQCFFFSRRDYKYSNSTRSNRATPQGFWKVTGRDRKIIDKGTNKVIGTKKTLVFYKGRVPHGHKTNWVIHEYHDALLSLEQRTHLLCWLKKKNEKKTKEKIHQLVDWSNNSTMVEHENQTNKYMTLEEYHFSNMSTTIQTYSQLNEATDSMTQLSSQSYEVIESMTQLPSQSNETTDSITQSPSQSNEVTASITQPSQLNEDTDSMMHTPFESNSTVETIFDAGEFGFSLLDAEEFGFSLFDAGEFGFSSHLELPSAPSMDELGLSEMMAPSDMHPHEA